MAAMEAGEAASVTLASDLAVLRSAVVSPSGLLAATYGTADQDAHSLTIWNVPSRMRQARAELDMAPMAVRFTPDETAIVLALRNSQVAEVARRPVSAADGAIEVIYRAPDIAGIAMSRDSRTVVLRGRGTGLTVFDTVSRETRSLGKAAHFGKVAVSPRGELAAALTGDSIEIYRLAGPYDAADPLGASASGRVGVVGLGPVNSMDCSAGLVVAASGHAVSIVWNEGGEAYEVYAAPEQVRRIAVSTGGGVVAVAYDSGFTVVDLGTGDALMERVTESPVDRLTFRLDDKILVTAHDDSNARLWELPDTPSQSSDRLAWQSDAPARVDLLQRVPLARALAARLRRLQREEPSSSFLVHIDGPWGSGKSTLLRLLQRELEQAGGEEPRRPRAAEWLAVDFNAWQQSKVGAPWWALLAALRRDMARDRRLPARWRLRAIESWARLRRAGAPFILACLVLVALAAGIFFLLRPSRVTFASSVGIAQGIGALIVPLGTLWAGARIATRLLLWDSAQGARLYEQSGVNPMLDVSRHFGWLTAKAGKPVVFFVDDLDRCADSYVVELLETVQTLIRDPPDGGRRAGPVNPPSFVVAADGAWIRRSFETAYDQFKTSVAEPGLPLGYLFLDKLFQLRVRVPRVDAVRQELYLMHLLGIAVPGSARSDAASRDGADRMLGRLGRSSSEADIVAALSAASPEVRDLAAAAAVEKLNSPPVAMATEHWLQQFMPLLPPNPRAMKRFINDYSILRTVRTLEGSTVGMAPLALWAIVETRWPSLADYLCAHPQTIGLVRQAKPGAEPQPSVKDIPADLQGLFTDPEFAKLVTFHPGGPLTAELIAQCCGLKEPPSE